MSYILTEKSLTLHNEETGNIITVPATHDNWRNILEVLKNKTLDESEKFEKIDCLVNPLSNISITCGKVEIKDRRVLYQGTVLHNALTERLLKMVSEGFDAHPLAYFLSNLEKNPSRQSVVELYGFLEANALPITADGCFVGYKAVRHDFLDLHSGTISNTPGAIVEMPRNRVDDRSEVSCSFGLHVGSYSYFNSWGDLMLAVKVNPRDVVSVPSDYNQSKMRVCRYEVLHVLKNEDLRREDTLAKYTVYDDNDWYTYYKEESKDDYYENDED